jgi:uncharacterized membrane protein
MGSTFVDRYDTPEAAIAALKHQRTTKLLLAIGGLILALGTLFGVAAMMYLDDPVSAPMTAPK